MNKYLATATVAFLGAIGGATVVIGTTLERNYLQTSNVAQMRSDFKPVLAAVTAEALLSKTYQANDWVTAPDPRFETCMQEVLKYMNVSELRLVLYTGCPVLRK